MASRKVWIVGGCLVVVIGAAAYLNSNSTPAGKDAAGTVVEVSRTHTDSATPPAVADQAAIPTPAAGAPDAAAAANAAKGDAGSNAPAAADAADAAGGNSAMMHSANRTTNRAADRSANRAAIRAADRAADGVADSAATR
jgi:hypothetical protein